MVMEISIHGDKPEDLKNWWISLFEGKVLKIFFLVGGFKYFLFSPLLG